MSSGNSPLSDSPGLWSALRTPSFTILFAGMAVSALGDGMSWVAISWLAIDLAHGRDTGLLVGAAVAAYTLPGVVAGIGLGGLLSRFDPRLLILLDAVLRMVCLGLVAVAAWLGILAPAAYLVLLAASSLFALLGLTGELTAVVEMLPPAQHAAGNSLLTVASFATSIAGPGLAGGLILLAGPGPAIGADAASYAALTVAVLVSRRMLRPSPVRDPHRSVPQALRSLRRHPAVLGITLLSLVFFGIYGPVEVALPVYVAQSLRAGPGLLGGYFTLFAVGATAGALGATSLQRFGLWRVAIVVMVGWGLCLVPFGLVNSALVGFVALGVGGLIYGPFVPLKRTIIQRYSPRGSLTALAAASGLVTLPASPIGTALGGPIVAVLGPRSTLLASGLATILAAAVAAAVLTRRQARARQTDLGA